MSKPKSAQYELRLALKARDNAIHAVNAANHRLQFAQVRLAQARAAVEAEHVQRTRVR